MKSKHSFLWLVLCLTLAACQTPGLVVSTGPITYRSAQSDNWSGQMPVGRGTYWLRTTVTIPRDYPADKPLGLLLSMLASKEVRWDGHLIGTDGKVGEDVAGEEAGQMTCQFLVPAHLSGPGVHDVEVRFSNFRGNGQFRIYTAIAGDYWYLAREQIITSNFVHIYAGFFLIIGLYFLIRSIILRRQFTNLLFGIISLLFFGLILFEYMRTYYHYPYTWHFTRLQIILTLTFLIAFLLPLFFSVQFDFERPRVYKIVGFMLLAFGGGLMFTKPLGFDPASMMVMLIGFGFSLYIVTVACLEEKKGSVLALIGVAPIPASCWYWVGYYDYIIYIGFGHLTLMTLIALAGQEREQRRIQQESMLLSARLEKELIKKNIQPHFLMNSLTSAIDWIEEYPQKGVELLYALVQEFDIMLRIADKKLIPIMEEISLCQAHLKIMSYRKEQQFSLHTNGIVETEEVPPAVLHTILENGITHNRLDKAVIHFHLTFSYAGQRRCYHILCENDIPGHRPPPQPGTGLQYVLARLEESYPGQWEFEHGPALGGWETSIVIG